MRVILENKPSDTGPLFGPVSKGDPAISESPQPSDLGENSASPKLTAKLFKLPPGVKPLTDEEYAKMGTLEASLVELLKGKQPK